MIVSAAPLAVVHARGQPPPGSHRGPAGWLAVAAGYTAGWLAALRRLRAAPAHEVARGRAEQADNGDTAIWRDGKIIMVGKSPFCV
jgi:hypothetical protein